MFGNVLLKLNVTKLQERSIQLSALSSERERRMGMRTLAACAPLAAPLTPASLAPQRSSQLITQTQPHRTTPLNTQKHFNAYTHTYTISLSHTQAHTFSYTHTFTTLFCTVHTHMQIHSPVLAHSVHSQMERFVTFE